MRHNTQDSPDMLLSIQHAKCIEHKFPWNKKLCVFIGGNIIMFILFNMQWWNRYISSQTSDILFT